MKQKIKKKGGEDVKKAKMTGKKNKNKKGRETTRRGRREVRRAG